MARYVVVNNSTGLIVDEVVDWNQDDIRVMPEDCSMVIASQTVSSKVTPFDL